jgi:hypothetical protein
MSRQCFKKASYLQAWAVLGWGEGAALDTWWGDGRAGELGLFLVGGESVGAVEVLVDNHAHAALAVVALGLRAVEPEWLLILDNDGEDVGVLALGGWHEAGEDGVVVDGLAGLGEGRLSEGVILRVEVDLDEVANLCDDVLRLEVETVEAGDDTVGGSVRGGCNNTGWWSVCGAGWVCCASWHGRCEGSGANESDGCEADHFDDWESYRRGVMNINGGVGSGRLKI